MQQKEGTPALCDSADGTGEHYAKWNKPGGERQIPYDLTYKWNLINKTSEQNRTRDMEIKNKLIAIYFWLNSGPEVFYLSSDCEMCWAHLGVKVQRHVTVSVLL